MKKIINIFLLCIYTASVVGVSVNRFYCCGRLESTTVSAIAFAKNNTQDDGCCQHRQNILKVNDSHESSEAAKVAKSGFIFIHVLPNIYPNDKLKTTASSAKCNPIKGPPLLLHTPLYTQFCNYRI